MVGGIVSGYGMFRLAWRQLLLDPSRTLLTAVAIAAVIATILILSGFEQGQYYQLKQVVMNRNADLIATQAGVVDFTAVRSTIPQLARGEVESVAGVKGAYPVTAIAAIYNQNNERTPIYILVYDQQGGPASIVQGTGIREGRDVVIDESLARKYNLQPGDRFEVTDFAFRVAGITREAAFMMPFAFISYDGMIDLFLESEIAPDLSTFPLLSFLLIELDSTTDRNQVAQQIKNQVPTVDVMTPEQLADNDVAMGKALFGPIMGLLVMIGYFIGILVVGLIMYADVRGRLNNFAVLKALGFGFHKLALAVSLQVLLLLAIAVPCGVLLATSVAQAIETASPLYLIRIFAPLAFSKTLLASLGFALLGSLIPLRLVQRSDPVMAFQRV